MAHEPLPAILQRDLAGLETQLRALLQPFLQNRSHLSALNIACGRADETEVLSRVLRSASETVELTGLDIRGPEIGQARSRWKEQLEKKSDGTLEIQFLEHRGDQIDHLQQLNQPGLSFIRHQNYWHDPPVWTELFRQTLDQLADDGLLVITSYFDKEHSLALAALQRLGATLLCTHRNPTSRPLRDGYKKSVDRHLAIFSKPESNAVGLVTPSGESQTILSPDFTKK